MKLYLVALACSLCAAPAFADKIDAYLKEQMAKGRIPGLAVGVIRNGRLVKAVTYGYTDLEQKTVVGRDTVFEVGAINKQFTAAGIMLLAQAGRLSLDDKIATHLTNTPSTWSNITVRQLMNHTSGIKSYTDMTNSFRLSDHLTQSQFIEVVGGYPLEFSPGALYKYGNSGFLLLGYIIENVTGTNYWDWMTKEVFLPLGMVATGDRNPRRIIPRRAHGYERNNSGSLDNRDTDLTDLFSTGAMATSLNDLARWNEALRNGRILSAANRAQMWAPTTLTDGTVAHYGLGWGVATSGRANVGHSGYTSGFSSTYQIYPADRLTIIVLCNLGEESLATILADDLAKFYLQ
jgi:D-alanyl-D-alanine carboxypeptidase